MVKYLNKIYFFALFIIFYSINLYATDFTVQLIDNGEFQKATEAIFKELTFNKGLAQQNRLNLLFELERMGRIKKDFTKTEEDITGYIKRYIPSVNEENINKWEENGALEYMIIDGDKWYFSEAAPNLFRIDREAKLIKEKIDGADKKEFPLNKHLANIINETKTKTIYNVLPVTFRIKQSIVVKQNTVPEGEIIRCWLPYPRYIPGRQIDIKLIKTDPETFILASNKRLQRTIYFEKAASHDLPTTFSATYEYTSYGHYIPIDPDKVVPAIKSDELIAYLGEKPPHIVFTQNLRTLADTITVDESNPYKIAQKLFEWVYKNVPWAAAREYSTINNISEYAALSRHGDCGIKTMLFIALCRLKGIPARWQSGWEFQPPAYSMHDWCELYFEPYGWVPVDVTYGLRETDNERLKWFYLSGIDSYRLIFNDDDSVAFYPLKVHFRSDTVDSQRGEVEWRGGNLYYDSWQRKLEWSIISNVSN